MSNTAQNLIKVIDFCKNKINKQGMPSYYRRSDVDGEIDGMYRMGFNGIACNVGHLIPDESYDPDFEFNSVDEVYQLEWLEKVVPGVKVDSDRGMYEELLLKLQTLHDECLEDVYSTHRGMMHNRDFLNLYNQKMDKLRGEYLLV